MKLSEKVYKYIYFETRESGPMGKTRNLALAISIAAVQKGKTLFIFFMPKKLLSFSKE